MIHQIWRDPEWAKRNRRSVLQMLHALQQQSRRREYIRGSQNSFRRLADQKQRFLGQPVSNAVMILMWVRNDNAEQIGIWRFKPLDWMQREAVRIGDVQRQSNVQDDSLPLRFQLDAWCALRELHLFLPGPFV